LVWGYVKEKKKVAKNLFVKDAKWQIYHKEYEK